MAGGDDPTPENATARFLGDPPGWAGARIELADIHGLWGGCSVALAGDGHCVITRVRLPGAPDGTETRNLGAAAARRLLDQCIAQDLLTIRFPPRPFIVPDEARPEIRLTNAAGEQQTVGCWANDPKDPRFEAIYAALRGLATGQGGEPTPPGL
jgi:hypothetical protein